MSSIVIEQREKDRRTGAIVTVLFHVLLAILFLFIGLRQPDPLPQEHHIELVMEDMGGGGGSISAPQPGTPQPQPAPSPVVEQPEEVATEDESPVEMPKPKPQPKPKPVPAEPEPPKPNPSALFSPSTTPAPSETGTPGGSQPSTQPGQGGIGAFHGKGFEGRLDGRGLAKTPSFGNENTEAGKVAVDIRVDPGGKVVWAKGRLDRPTTTTSAQLHALAVKYAKEFTFTANPGATTDQAGYIVFEFILQ